MIKLCHLETDRNKTISFFIVDKIVYSHSPRSFRKHYQGTLDFPEQHKIELHKEETKKNLNDAGGRWYKSNRPIVSRKRSREGGVRERPLKTIRRVEWNE